MCVYVFGLPISLCLSRARASARARRLFSFYILKKRRKNDGVLSILVNEGERKEEKKLGLCLVL